MSKIMVMNVPGYGHVNPTLPVVQALVQRGHQVIYYNTEDFRAPIERTGAAFRPYPSYALTQREMVDTVNKSLAHVSVLLLKSSQRMTGYMVAELEREQPDFVIYDSICLWGMQAARVLNIPSVASITTLVLEGSRNLITPRDLLHMFRRALLIFPKLISYRKGLAQQYGKGSLPKTLFPAVGGLNIVYTSHAFQPTSTFIDERFRFVGPAIQPALRGGDFPFDQLAREPVVYISLGTIHNDNTDFYRLCFESFADHPGQFILSVGKHTDIRSLPSIPANFIVRNSVPQLDVLQHVDLFITHGGINSVQEGLYYGVPLVVIPQQLEQAANGRQVVAKGAGLLLGDTPPYGRAAAAELRAAVEKVLTDESYAQAARRVGDSFREAGGYMRAVAEIEDFAQTIERSPGQEFGRLATSGVRLPELP